MKKYLIQVGQKVLPSWTDYSEYHDLDDLMQDIDYLKQKITESNFRWTTFRVISIETTELFRV